MPHMSGLSTTLGHVAIAEYEPRRSAAARRYLDMSFNLPQIIACHWPPLQSIVSTFISTQFFAALSFPTFLCLFRCLLVIATPIESLYITHTRYYLPGLMTRAADRSLFLRKMIFIGAHAALLRHAAVPRPPPRHIYADTPLRHDAFQVLESERPIARFLRWKSCHGPRHGRLRDVGSAQFPRFASA